MSGSEGSLTRYPTQGPSREWDFQDRPIPTSGRESPTIDEVAQLTSDAKDLRRASAGTQPPVHFLRLKHRRFYMTTTISTSPLLRSTFTLTSCSWRTTARSTLASAILRLRILASFRKGGSQGRTKEILEAIPSIVNPRLAWKSRNTDAADHACGAQATGYRMGPSPGSREKPQNNSGTDGDRDPWLCRTIP